VAIDLTSASSGNLPAKQQHQSLSAAARLVRQQIAGWKFTDALPAGINESIVSVVEAKLREAMVPAGTKAAAVLLDRLFTVLRMPSSDVLTTWLDLINGYPPGVLRRAIDGVLRRYKWNSVPRPADIVEQIVEDRDYNELIALHNKIRTLRLKLRRPSRVAA